MVVSCCTGCCLTVVFSCLVVWAVLLVVGFGWSKFSCLVDWLTRGFVNEKYHWNWLVWWILVSLICYFYSSVGEIKSLSERFISCGIKIEVQADIVVVGGPVTPVWSSTLVCSTVREQKSSCLSLTSNLIKLDLSPEDERAAEKSTYADTLMMVYCCWQLTWSQVRKKIILLISLQEVWGQLLLLLVSGDS